MTNTRNFVIVTAWNDGHIHISYRKNGVEAIQRAKETVEYFSAVKSVAVFDNKDIPNRVYSKVK